MNAFCKESDFHVYESQHYGEQKKTPIVFGPKVNL